MGVGRTAKAIWLHVIRRRSLSQRFLVAAALVIGSAMLGLGIWTGHFVQQSITRGVTETAAASVSSLLSHAIGSFDLTQPLTYGQRRDLALSLALAAESSGTPLLNIRLRDLEGGELYVADPYFVDSDDDDDDFDRSTTGTVRGRVLTVDLPGVGPIAELPLDILEIYVPIRSSATGAVMGVAELYYSADALNRLRDQARTFVWALVGLTGLAAIATLYLVVDRATRTIARQRRRLAAQLAASRRLGSENLALSREAENLRRQATTANETLLAHVGSDIHDGPMQLLTLTILGLSKARLAGTPGLDTTIANVTEALEELRTISKGLVLPELADASLGEAIEMAIARHEQVTGTNVERALIGLEVPAPPAVRIIAYRVVQEALTNAFRHAGGEEQKVTAELVDGALTLRIDNATGGAMSPDISESRLGLRGMRFRVESTGGDLRLEFGQPVTSVVATIPLATAIEGSPPSA